MKRIISALLLLKVISIKIDWDSGHPNEVGAEVFESLGGLLGSFSGSALGNWRNSIITVIVLCLIMVTHSYAAHAAPGPDGFAGVPWEASQQQVAQAMAAQGFSEFNNSFSPQKDGSIIVSYQGDLDGVAGIYYFAFLNGAFYGGTFGFLTGDGGDSERDTYTKFLSIIQSKYGVSTRTGQANPNGAYNVWDGLQAQGSSDKIQIYLEYTAQNSRCGSQRCSSHFMLAYTNQSLQHRLEARNKNGL